jgi:hypothetical protein
MDDYPVDLFAPQGGDFLAPFSPAFNPLDIVGPDFPSNCLILLY